MASYKKCPVCEYKNDVGNEFCQGPDCPEKPGLCNYPVESDEPETEPVIPPDIGHNGNIPDQPQPGPQGGEFGRGTWLATMAGLECVATGRCLNVQPAQIIGRDNEINITGFPDYQYISRQHASFSALDNTWHIRDLGSISGTYVNGERVQAGDSKELREGDVIMLGRTKFWFRER